MSAERPRARAARASGREAFGGGDGADRVALLAAPCAASLPSWPSRGSLRPSSERRGVRDGHRSQEHPRCDAGAADQVGRQYGSGDTLEQANQTLSALLKYASQVAAEGFIAEDGARLREARDMLVAAGVGRETARGGKKVTNQAYADALAEGKKKRVRGRTVLENTMSVLAESSEPSAADAVR